MADVSGVTAVDPAGSVPPQSQTAGATLTDFDVVYRASDTHLEKADASAAATADVEGIIGSDAADGEDVLLYPNGSTIKITGATFTNGETYYLSENAGNMCLRTDVTTSGAQFTRVGYATSTTTLVVDIKNRFTSVP